MTWVLPLSQVDPPQRPDVGGKGFALAEMARAGIPVPETLCISTRAYEAYVSKTGLRERIMLELSRKDFAEMRWEELWDGSLRIRNLFLRTPMPDDLAAAISQGLTPRFHLRPAVVRSSAPGEDSETVSFAGLHESFVNVVGIDDVLEHVRLVWASLWSDAALLYRQDLNLDVSRSTMAVVVQALVRGDRSGVAFSRSPNDPSQAVIESVYGLNQGLVDGTVEPDQWIIHRATGELLTHVAPSREQMLVAGDEGVRLEPLPQELSLHPPLSSDDVAAVFDHVRRLEALFGGPQDVEWTWGEAGLVILQSRPITTPVGGDPDDERRWYLSLRRSFENLQALRDKIEGELIPGMMEEAQALSARSVDHLPDQGLAAEIDRRQRIYDEWVQVYWDEFIPFAHGIRLFGQVYNDALHPEDPYAFMDLLAGTDMASLARNQALEQMAAMIRDDAGLAEALRQRLTGGEGGELSDQFQQRLDEFLGRFGDLSFAMASDTRSPQAPDALIKVLLEMASHPRESLRREPGQADRPSRSALRDEYLNQFAGEERVRAAELLDLARTSYRLRDDDNIYLGAIEAEMLVAAEEGRKRLSTRGGGPVDAVRVTDLAKMLRDPTFVPQTTEEEEVQDGFLIRARQLIGQPAGPGVAHGTARVVVSQYDLTSFEHGEILVCDAVDPNMTFVVPLAAAVVERRGGMLIHGAIIAREYGLPCVTGVPDVTSLIHTGDTITVDGHLGIVTLSQRTEAAVD